MYIHIYIFVPKTDIKLFVIVSRNAAVLFASTKKGLVLFSVNSPDEYFYIVVLNARNFNENTMICKTKELKLIKLKRENYCLHCISICFSVHLQRFLCLVLGSSCQADWCRRDSVSQCIIFWHKDIRKTHLKFHLKILQLSVT